MILSAIDHQITTKKCDKYLQNEVSEAQLSKCLKNIPKLGTKKAKLLCDKSKKLSDLGNMNYESMSAVIGSKCADEMYKFLNTQFKSYF